jgi:hypothetical protein
MALPHEPLQRKAYSSDSLCVARGLVAKKRDREQSHMRWQGHAQKNPKIDERPNADLVNRTCRWRYAQIFIFARLL